jgi:hypothetical protein
VLQYVRLVEERMMVKEMAYMMHDQPIHPRDPNQKQRIGGKANNRDVRIRQRNGYGKKCRWISCVLHRVELYREGRHTIEDVDAIAGGGAIGVGPSTSGSESSE